ncbi:MAG TPA: hypothetical protein VGL66_16595 [Caulobacteraceae bacterium]|jgi:tetratricopeptide (TPR) repeat protein
MVDRMFEEYLGGDGEESEDLTGEAALATSEAVAASVAVQRRTRKGGKAAQGDPDTAAYFRDERVLLKKQSHMLDVQMEHLHEQRDLHLKHLHARRWREALQIATQLAVTLAAVLAIAGLGLMLIDAVTARSVVVDPFDTPPALAQSGVSGRVVASGVLDELTRLQADTRGSAAKRRLSNAWTGEIRVQVPDTGVSISEIDRFLKQRFGHEQHIAGDLVQGANGALVLTVRGDRIKPKSFTGGAGDLKKLSTQAAEYLYGQAEPALYIVYLLNNGRSAEAITFSKQSFVTASAQDKPYILNQWANAIGNTGGSQTESLKLFQTALMLKPDLWVAHNNVINTLWGLGREEEAWRAGETMRHQAGGHRPKPGVDEIYYENWDTLTWNLGAWRASTTADLEANNGIGTQTSADAPSLADIDQRMHDPRAAELALSLAPEDPNDPTIAAMRHFVQGRIAAEAGDTATAATELQAFNTAYANPVVSTNYPGYNCWAAPAAESAGQAAMADAVLAKAGTFVDCARFKADIMDHRGDWAGAQKQYAAAVALAPDLPAAYYSWGLALAKHGNLKGAEAKFAQANARGPHWADPLKAWGDALAQQGQWREALKKYDAALPYAPVWIDLIRAKTVAAHKA